MQHLLTAVVLIIGILAILTFRGLCINKGIGNNLHYLIPYTYKYLDGY